MFEVTALGNGRYRVSDGQRHRLAYAAGPADARWVFLDGQVFVIDRGRGEGGRGKGEGGKAEGDWSRGKGKGGRGRDEMALAAPMPATVAAVNVEPGQEVSQGDVLIMLEAMKMELPITAPRAGRVKAIAWRRGDKVQPGMPLLELE